MAKKTETPAAGEGKQPASFEEGFAQLQDIVRELESGDQSLDESLKLYEKGIASLRTCHALLDQAEQRIRKLVAASGGKVQEEPFGNEGYAGETTELPVEPGAISSGPTQILKAVTDPGETVRKPAGPKRGRGAKDSSLFSD